MGSNPVAVTLTSDMAPVLIKEFLETQETIECRFTLKRIHDMIEKYSQRVYIKKNNLLIVLFICININCII